MKNLRAGWNCRRLGEKERRSSLQIITQNILVDKIKNLRLSFCYRLPFFSSEGNLFQVRKEICHKDFFHCFVASPRYSCQGCNLTVNADFPNSWNIRYANFQKFSSDIVPLQHIHFTIKHCNTCGSPRAWCL